MTSAAPTREQIRRGIEELARQESDWDGELQDGLRLVEDLRLDSIRVLSLAVAVEDRFRIRLDEGDEAAIATVGDLVSTVGRKLATPPSGDA